MRGERSETIGASIDFERSSYKQMERYYEKMKKIVAELLEMETDTYIRCKYIIILGCGLPERREFFEKLFSMISEYRPLLIETKEGVAV